MSIRTNLSVLVAAALAFGIGWTACTSETQQGGGTEPTPGGGDSERREVLLTLNNKLALQAGTKAADTKAIATVAENAIQTLDVYVFGCDTEGGEYTFQERFAYRAGDNDKLPAGASELQLAVQGTDGATTTGLLSLKRGLFVKLYCIANDTLLVDPAAGGVAPVKATAFVPLTLSDPAEGSVKVLKTGTPLESSFTSYHTRLLTAATKGDTLACPLAMSGALTTALDLTSFDNSARLQAGFRLTRLAARFDIQNVAKDSRFTLQSVSMGSGRRGSGYFPIRVYGDLPTAKPAELITWPARTFYGTAANTGLCEGAFYSYPSSEADKGYLILKGLYKVNETENKEVSYQIPFRQKNANGQELFLDINHNHRYTIAITAADAYHLDASITVADWADDGSIEYKPENKPGEVFITIPAGYADETVWTKDTRVVSMSVKDGSSFTATISTNSALMLKKVYAGGLGGQLNDWLQISEPKIVTGATLSTYTYTFTLTPNYKKAYPRTVIHLTNTIDGSETTFFVEPVAAPAPIETPQPPKAPNGSSENPNSFDPVQLTASLYRITGSMATININCPDGVELATKPDWLDVAQTGVSGPITSYELKLNTRDVVVAGNSGKVTFRNKKKADLTIDVNVSLLDAPVVPNYDGIGGDNSFTPENGTTPTDVQLKITPSNKATVKVTSMDGVSVKIAYPEGSPEWLSFSGAAATKAAVAPVKESATATTATAKVTTAAAVKAPAPAAASPLSGFTVASLPGSPSDPANYVTKAAVMQKVEDIVFTPIADKLAGAQQATVTLTNIIGGKEKRLTITPEMQGGSAVESTTAPSLPLQSLLKDKTITLYQLPGAAAATSQMTIDVTSLGGSKLTAVGTGLTLSPSQSTANTAAYVLKPALATDKNTDTGSATLSIKNYTDASVAAEDYAVSVLHSDLTGGTAMSLNTTKDQTANALINSYEGFTVNPTIDWQGGTQWFKISSATDNVAGQNVKVIATATGATGTVRPGIVTLNNKIVNGGDLKVTVTPVYAAPTLTQITTTNVTPMPTQNLLTPGPTASTLKLYRVVAPATSILQFTSTSIGGSKVGTVSGVTVTPNAGYGEFNTANSYTVKWDGTATSGSFQIVNSQDANKVQTVTVQLPATINSSPGNINLNTALNQTAATTFNTPEGFTAAVAWGGGSAWFTLDAADFAAGNKTVTVKSTAPSGVNIRTATVTLTNKIVGGENKTFTVTPTFAAPTVVYADNNSPVQNSMPNNTTANLYNVSGSRLNVSVTSVGGVTVFSNSGVNVSANTSDNTSNTYTLTWNGSAAPGNYSVVFANKRNTNLKTTLNVTILNNAITANDASVNAANSGTNSIPVTSPAGCTASILNDNWNGGGQWFNMTNPTAGPQNLVITQLSNNVNTLMKPVTVRLTSAMVGGTGVFKDITVTPTNFQKPTLSATSGSVGVATLNTSATSASFTMTVPAGGVAPQSSNPGIATISVSGTTVTITPKSVGTTTIIVPNASNTGVSETYTVTVKGTYNGAKVWYYNGYYIAATNANEGTTWTANLTDYCADKAPNGTWKVPSDAEWRVIIGGTSGTNHALDTLYQEMKSKSVFAAGTFYWSSTAGGSDRAYYLRFGSSSAYVINDFRSYSNPVRCVSQ